MGQRQTGKHCAHCQKNIMATKTTPNHILHLILTLLTGVWVIVWIVIAISNTDGGWRCTQCGGEV